MIGGANLSFPAPGLSAAQGEQDAEKIRRAGNDLETRGLSQEEKEKRLKKACEQFEAMLVKMVLKSMREASPKDGLLGSGLDSEIYTSMMDDSIADSISKGRGMGIAQAMYEQMKGRIGSPATPHDAGVEAASDAHGHGHDNDTAVPGLKQGAAVRPEETIASPAATSEVGKRKEDGGGVNALGHPLGKGTLSSQYGWRTDPITSERRFHKGIDFAAPMGTPISAAAEGEVVYSGWQGGHGNTVVIRHSGGYETRYSHNAENLVKEGDRVLRGQMVARVGSTGRSTGPHLHFEVRKGNTSLDPAELIA